MGERAVLQAEGPITVFSPDLIPRLKKMALESELKRARYCLHMSIEDLVQEMVIVLHKDSQVRPHRHRGKTESFHVMEGEVLVVFFDETGKTLHKLSLGGKNPVLYRLSADFWHTAIALTEFAVFHEVATGPFVSSEFPLWEPLEDLKKMQDQQSVVS